MQKIGFAEALNQILGADPRYEKDAYLFLQDALDFTLKSRKKQRTDLSRHVSGQELLEGVRQYALAEFGPMVPTVFEAWNIRECADIGNIVFNLIKAGIFGKTDSDSIEDFQGGYDFHEAFVKPFLPEKPPAPAKGKAGQPAAKPL